MEVVGGTLIFLPLNLSVHVNASLGCAPIKWVPLRRLACGKLAVLIWGRRFSPAWCDESGSPGPALALGHISASIKLWVSGPWVSGHRPRPRSRPQPRFWVFGSFDRLFPPWLICHFSRTSVQVVPERAFLLLFTPWCSSCVFLGPYWNLQGFFFESRSCIH